MNQPEVFVVEELPATLEGQRLDRVISLLTDISRNMASEIIKNGEAKVDDKPITKPSTRLVAGCKLNISVPFIEEKLAVEENILIDVIYSDEHIIVIDKAPGLVVHPGAGNNSGTLVNGLLAQFPEIINIGEPHRPGIVHRLDKDTSGLIVVARSQSAYEWLKLQLSERHVERTYLSVVQGVVQSSNGLIDAPLGRSLKDPTKRDVVASGKSARTRYSLLDSTEKYSLLECKLETGRTHQIRVHMSSIGHPVLGDTKYGAKDTDLLDRFFLHAKSLSFIHPETGESVSFESKLPEDLTSALTSLGLKYDE